MAAITGNGTIFSWGVIGQENAIGQVLSVSGPSVTAATIDVTDISGTSKTFIAGMIDGGEISLEVSYDPDTEDGNRHTDLTTDMLTGATGTGWQIEWSDGSKVSAGGIVTSFSASASIDDKVTASFTIKVTGAVTFTPDTA